MNLFLLWFTLFIFFAIVFVEVFALTRWDTAETHNQNYSSFGKSCKYFFRRVVHRLLCRQCSIDAVSSGLGVLRTILKPLFRAFMSTGEGWNQYMHDL